MQRGDSFKSYSIGDVAGVVVLFNPEESVIENILSFSDQVKFLIIVDNSQMPSAFINDFVSNNKDKTEYIFNGENLGVAAALNIGAQRAVAGGYSFLLTMDQDSKAPPGMVSSLLELFQTGSNIGIVSPLHSNKYGTHIKNLDDYVQVYSVMTSGNLLSLEAYKLVGGFSEDFFIDYVDIEYCFRLNNNKFKIIQLNTVILNHNEANLSERKFLFRKYYPLNHSPFRMYYKTRNLLLLRNKFKLFDTVQLRHEYNLYIRTIVKIILFEKQKFRKIWMCLWGFLGYLKREKGRKF